MYQIIADRANKRVEVNFIDSFSDIDQEKLSIDLRAAALKAKGAGDHFDMIVDFTSVSIMPQHVTMNARGEIEWCIANGLRRSANVLHSTIAKMQIQRLSADDRFQTFVSRSDALAWLAS